MPVTVMISTGRSASTLATRSRPAVACALSAALPGAKGTVPSSSPPLPPKALASKVNGAVMALVIRLTMTFRITEPRLNCGSFSEPEIGRLMSITPLRSASSATASFTGRLAVEPSTFSPKASWLSTMLLLALSCPSGCTR